MYLDGRDNFLKENRVILFDHSQPCALATWPQYSNRAALACSGVDANNTLTIAIPAIPLTAGTFRFEADVVAITGVEIETQHTLGKVTWSEKVYS